MDSTSYSHFLHLPKGVSQSGLKPSIWARLKFVFLGVFLVTLIANGALGASLEGVIYPGVSVGGHDLSWKTRAQALQILQSNPPMQHLTVKVGDKLFEADNKTLGVEYDLQRSVDMAYEQGRIRNLPILGVMKTGQAAQLGYVYHIDNQVFNTFTDKVVKSVGTDPVNSSLQINEGEISVVQAKPGYRVSAELLNTLIQQSVVDAKDQIVALAPVVTQADIQPEDTVAASDQAKRLMAKRIALKYEDKTFTPNAATIGHWIIFSEKKNDKNKMQLELSVDQKQVEGYIQSVANDVNVAPINKKVTVKNGVTNVDREGTDGMAIDQLSAAKAVTTAMTDDSAFNYTITSSPVPFKTESNTIVTLDLGRYIEVNLSQQHLWIYQDHQVIYESPVTSGATGAGFPTVTGLFSIYYKATNTYLNGAPYGYNYNVHVNYWMPFYQGYGLHDAYWRGGVFGGQDYYYNGSHGCVNLPDATAAFIYNWGEVGTPVWVHN